MELSLQVQKGLRTKFDDEDDNKQMDAGRPLWKEGEDAYKAWQLEFKHDR